MKKIDQRTIPELLAEVQKIQKQIYLQNEKAETLHLEARCAQVVLQGMVNSLTRAVNAYNKAVTAENKIQFDEVPPARPV